MGVHVQCSGGRYAVVQASSNKDKPERLVIAYQDENCLRDLIAAPSIFGLGFSSREEAMRHLKGLSADAAPWKQGSRITAMFHVTHKSNEFLNGRGLVKKSRMPSRVVQSTLAALIALFHSRNLVSAMIRVALGASL
jgi:hypothetical protein